MNKIIKRKFFIVYICKLDTMSYYCNDYSYSDYSCYSDYDDSDDELVWCKHCPNQMPRFALDGHITRKHLVQCNLCNSQVLESNWQRHINRAHPQPINDPNYPSENHTIALRVTPWEFQHFVRQRRIYVKNGQNYLNDN